MLASVHSKTGALDTRRRPRPDRLPSTPADIADPPSQVHHCLMERHQLRDQAVASGDAKPDAAVCGNAISAALAPSVPAIMSARVCAFIMQPLQNCFLYSATTRRRLAERTRTRGPEGDESDDSQARHARLGCMCSLLRFQSPTKTASFWNPLFPGQIPDDLVLAEPLPSDTLSLEGHTLVASRSGTPTPKPPAASTYRDRPDHCPRRRLQRLYLVESSPEGRREWMAALDTIESLRPQAVIAGHQRACRHDPEIIEETRQYIRDFERILESTDTARELCEQDHALHPSGLNPGALWSSARALKP